MSPGGWAVEPVWRTGTGRPGMDGGWYVVTHLGFVVAEVRTPEEVAGVVPDWQDLREEGGNGYEST